MSDVGVGGIVDGRYLLLAELGHGNMGTVYRALDRMTGEHVALKVVRHRHSRTSIDGTPCGDSLTLAQEFRILSVLRHPNVIDVYNFGFDEHGYPYYSMELLSDAAPLTDYARGLTFEQKTGLLVQLLRALRFLHWRSVLHGDLKPRNVLVTEIDGEPRVKVLDFGLCSLLDQPTAQASAGTPAYMAPELWNGAACSRASDMYAFGVIAYEVYAGQRPFDTLNLQRLKQAARNANPDLSVLDVPQHVREVIGWLLAKSPDSRCADATEVIRILESGVDFVVTAETPETRESFLQTAQFVGREAEMARLTGMLNEALAGRGGALLVGGESGVGKSRLLDELWTQALVLGAGLVRGRARREGVAGYGLWYDLLRWLLLYADLDPAERAVLRAALPEADQMRGFDAPLPPPLPPEAAQERLLMTIEAALGRTHKPLVVLLEDLHWDVGAGLTVLRHLAQIVHHLPLLIVASYRDDERPNLPSSVPGVPSMRLGRLGAADVARLVESMLGEAGRNPIVLRTLQTETEGNPFFVIEMVRAWAEYAGELSQVGKGPLPLHIMTGGMNGIIRWRLDRVPQRARLFIQAAAVAGREIDVPLLSEVMRLLGVTEPVDELLADCADAVVVQYARDGWEFAHVKLRDGVLQALPAEQARRLHECVGEAIITVYQVHQREIAPVLAYHWHRAGDAKREQRFVIVAAEQAINHGDYPLARAYLERARELLAEAPMPLRHQVGLLEKLGHVYAALNDQAEARAWYGKALEMAHDDKFWRGASSALNGLGKLALAARQDSVASDHFTGALTLANDARSTALMLSSLVGLAWLAYHNGQTITALEYAACVMANPLADSAAYYDGVELLKRIEPLLPEHVYTAGVQRGSNARLLDVVQNILVRARGALSQ